MKARLDRCANCSRATARADERDGLSSVLCEAKRKRQSRSRTVLRCAPSPFGCSRAMRDGSNLDIFRTEHHQSIGVLNSARRELRARRQSRLESAVELDTDLFVGPWERGGVRPLRVEQCEMTTGPDRGVAPVLAHCSISGYLQAQEKNVGLAMRNVGRRTRRRLPYAEPSTWMISIWRRAGGGALH